MPQRNKFLWGIFMFDISISKNQSRYRHIIRDIAINSGEPDIKKAYLNDRLFNA